MKIAELKLIRFGPFTDCQLDMRAGEHGLHLVYGPNEAGKSSSLRAITDFLFGIPTRTNDDFQHPYSNLRIGGQLQHSDGTTLSVVRRKANQKSLRCDNDTAPMADDALLPFLGDVDRDLFSTMFGINHQRLRQGGAEIAEGKGRIGEMLFAASAGLVDLQQLQANLQAEIDGLLKSTLRSGSIHQGIQDYVKHRQLINDAQVTVETWKRSEQELQAKQHQTAELDQQLVLFRKRLQHWQRLQNASSVVSRWKDRQEKLLALADAPRLEANFPDTANALLLELNTQKAQASTAAAELDKLTQQLDSLHIPEAVLQAATEIESLRDRVGAVRDALLARPTVEAKRQAVERDSLDILRDLNRGADLSQIDELRLPRDKTIKIQNVGTQLQSLLERLQSERKNCQRLERALELTNKELAALPDAIDWSGMRASLRSIQHQGDVESELAASQAALANLQQEVAVAVRQLPLVHGVAVDCAATHLEALPVPLASSLERFELEFSTVDRQLQTLRTSHSEDVRTREALAVRLAELEAEQVVPTVAELTRCREMRQQGWRLVSQELRSECFDQELLKSFMREFSAASDLSSAYQQAVLEADRVADALRTDADRVANQSQLHSDLDQAHQREARRQSEIELAVQTRQAIEQRWQQLWAPLGIAPLLPNEMHDWLRRQASIVTMQQKTREAQQQCELRRAQHAKLYERLQQLSQALPQPATSPSAGGARCPSPTLRELSQQVEARLDQLQAQASRREQLQNSFNEDRAELALHTAQFAATESEVQQLQADWGVEMKRLGLEQSALPAQANSRLDSLQVLFEKHKDIERYCTRLEHIDRDAGKFANDVAELTARVAPELSKLPAERALQGLVQYLEDARLAAKEASSLTSRVQQLQMKCQTASDKSSQASLQLDQMVQQAHVVAYEDLAAAAQRSRQRRELEQVIIELEDEIAEYRSGASLADFVLELETEWQAEQTLTQRIEDCQQQIEELGQHRDEVIKQLNSAEIELGKVDGNDAAGQEQANCESIAARLEDQVHSLAVLQISSAMLNAAIERHREKNQGPILGRASQIFREITLKKFVGLQAEFDEKGVPVLAGIRGTEQRVLVDGMSDGTCDQLYLALRLASLETWLEHHEPVPFIVDDVLMNFDDQRSIATLKVLAALSRRTQVIFFTHHQHLVELAREYLSNDDLFVITLDGQ